jgi:hypothetical protein
MVKRVLVVAVLLLTVMAPISLAQTAGVCQNGAKLGCLIPDVFGNTGLTLPNNFHRAHFDNDFQANFTPLNSAIASQLTLLPLASPASGFTYSFDRTAGVYTRSAQSFGPVLTERAETIGKGKVFFGLTYQRFGFDKIDGFDVRNFPAVFLHADEPPGNFAFKKDFITTENSVDLKVDQFTLFGTVGLTNWLDVSMAVPILKVKMSVRSTATIHRIAPPDPVFGQAHYFDAADPENSTRAVFTDHGSASGIGDILFRVKGTAYHGENVSIAIATDLRVPSGDEMNFLGSGAVGVKPFMAMTFRAGRLSPHVNLGYQWNGKSVLAGNIAAGTKGQLPDQFFFAVGADARIARGLTFSADLLTQRVYDGARVLPSDFIAPAPDGQRYFQIALEKDSYTVADAAAGLKYNLMGRLLVTGNVLFAINSGGLRDRVVPLVGISYTFH